MRLTIVTYSARKIGGIEQNLDVVLPELERLGHTLQFVYFRDEPPTRAPIRTGPQTERINASETGDPSALSSIEAFHPDLINVHGEVDPAFQTELLAIAPSAYSVHNYYGTCISGLKTHTFPVIQPCSKTFGPACLLHYFPRRCGGLNPLTMITRYNRERERLQVMSQYDAVITHSRHMEAEYTAHGLDSQRIHGLPYEVAATLPHPVSEIPKTPVTQSAKLLFVGRIEKLKGGQVLISALNRVQHALQRPVELHLAGDGPDRQAWEKLARRVVSQNPAIAIQFHGWATGAALQSLFHQSHLLVVPSLWPEPFGKVGPEAGTYGVPVAAFAVGGIEEWLLPGITGMVAPGNPPTAEGLAQAIVQCVLDPAIHAHLSAGALANVDRFHLRAHVDSLLALFERVCRERSVEPSLSPVA